MEDTVLDMIREDLREIKSEIKELRRELTGMKKIVYSTAGIMGLITGYVGKWIGRHL